MANIPAIKAKAAEYFQKGEYAKAIAEYKKVLEAEPTNASIYNFVGDSYVKLSSIEEAISHYQEAAKAYSQDALYNNAIAVCKKILRLKPEAEVYKTLGELYIQQGLISEALTNLIEYADRKLRENQIEAVLQTYQQIVELNPKNLSVRSKLAEMYLSQKKIEEAAKEFQAIAETYEEQGRIVEAEALQARVRAMYGEKAAPKPEPPRPEAPSVSLEVPPVEIIPPPVEEKPTLIKPEELIIKKEEALAPPPVVEEIKPADWSTNVELGDLLLEIGSIPEAIEQYHTAAEGYFSEGKIEKAESLYRKIAELQPLEIRTHQKLVEIAIASKNEKTMLSAYLSLAECLRRRELKEQAGAVYQKVLEIDPQNETALENLSLITQAVSPIPVKEEVVMPPPGLEEIKAPPPRVEIPVTPPPAKAPEEVKPEEKVLFGRPIVEGGKESRVRFSVAEGVSVPQEETISIAEIIDEFKEGVYQTIGEEDFQGHYDLGIAYKEMGLLDEAIYEFQIASKGKNERLKAFEMLGLCFLERGEPRFAVKQFERGLGTSGYPEEDYIGLHYGLGVAYEQLNDLVNALKEYETVYLMDINFKDVGVKVKRLREETKGLPPPPRTEAPPLRVEMPPPKVGVLPPEPEIPKPEPTLPPKVEPKRIAKEEMVKPEPVLSERPQPLEKEVTPPTPEAPPKPVEEAPKPKPIPSKLKKPEKHKISYV
ncbi:MAG: tetratricopeptide repeat protein [Candidatus Edwardsbacteria bacterium]